jgi:peptidoglycan/xylan/chitin deacetylase (PgdA/CDA1 family)
MTTVPVLLYHSISDSAERRNDPWSVRVDDFRADMDAVAASGRTTLTCAEFARCLRGEQVVPAQPILVTFDDGFADFADTALPILRSRGITSTLFMTTAWSGTLGMLSRVALRDLLDTGDVEVGAHSETHPHLDVVAGHRARREIEGSKAYLEDGLQIRIDSFAYPHGSHRRATKTLVAAAGYTNAVAVKNALSHASDDPYAVARFTVHGRSSRARVAAVIGGGGVPVVAPGERLVTSAYRVVRLVGQRTAMR